MVVIQTIEAPPTGRPGSVPKVSEQEVNEREAQHHQSPTLPKKEKKRAKLGEQTSIDTNKQPGSFYSSQQQYQEDLKAFQAQTEKQQEAQTEFNLALGQYNEDVLSFQGQTQRQEDSQRLFDLAREQYQANLLSHTANAEERARIQSTYNSALEKYDSDVISFQQQTQRQQEAQRLFGLAQQQYETDLLSHTANAEERTRIQTIFQQAQEKYNEDVISFQQQNQRQQEAQEQFSLAQAAHAEDIISYNLQYDAFRASNLEYSLEHEDSIRLYHSNLLESRIEQDLARWNAGGFLSVPNQTRLDELTSQIATRKSATSILETELLSLQTRKLSPAELTRFGELPDIISGRKSATGILETDLSDLLSANPTTIATHAGLNPILSNYATYKSNVARLSEIARGSSSLTRLLNEAHFLSRSIRDYNTLIFNTVDSEHHSSIRSTLVNLRPLFYYGSRIGAARNTTIPTYSVGLQSYIDPIVETHTSITSLQSKISSRKSATSLLETKLSNLRTRKLSPSEITKFNVTPVIISSRKSATSLLETESSSLIALKTPPRSYTTRSGTYTKNSGGISKFNRDYINRGWELVSSRTVGVGIRHPIGTVHYTIRKKNIPTAPSDVIATRQAEDTRISNILTPLDAFHTEQARIKAEGIVIDQARIQSRRDEITSRFQPRIDALILQRSNTTHPGRKSSLRGDIRFLKQKLSFELASFNLSLRTDIPVWARTKARRYKSKNPNYVGNLAHLARDYVTASENRAEHNRQTSIAQLHSARVNFNTQLEKTIRSFERARIEQDSLEVSKAIASFGTNTPQTSQRHRPRINVTAFTTLSGETFNLRIPVVPHLKNIPSLLTTPTAPLPPTSPPRIPTPTQPKKQDVPSLLSTPTAPSTPTLPSAIPTPTQPKKQDVPSLLSAPTKPEKQNVPSLLSVPTQSPETFEIPNDNFPDTISQRTTQIVKQKARYKKITSFSSGIEALKYKQSEALKNPFAGTFSSYYSKGVSQGFTGGFTVPSTPEILDQPELPKLLTDDEINSLTFKEFLAYHNQKKHTKADSASLLTGIFLDIPGVDRIPPDTQKLIDENSGFKGVAVYDYKNNIYTHKQTGDTFNAKTGDITNVKTGGEHGNTFKALYVNSKDTEEERYTRLGFEAINEASQRYKNTGTPPNVFFEGAVLSKVGIITPDTQKYIDDITANRGVAVYNYKNNIYTHKQTGDTFNSKTGLGSSEIKRALYADPSEPRVARDIRFALERFFEHSVVSGIINTLSDTSTALSSFAGEIGIPSRPTPLPPIPGSNPFPPKDYTSLENFAQYLGDNKLSHTPKEDDNVPSNYIPGVVEYVKSAAAGVFGLGNLINEVIGESHPPVRILNDGLIDYLNADRDVVTSSFDQILQGEIPSGTGYGTYYDAGSITGAIAELAIPFSYVRHFKQFPKLLARWQAVVKDANNKSTVANLWSGFSWGDRPVFGRYIDGKWAFGLKPKSLNIMNVQTGAHTSTGSRGGGDAALGTQLSALLYHPKVINYMEKTHLISPISAERAIVAYPMAKLASNNKIPAEGLGALPLKGVSQIQSDSIFSVIRYLQKAGVGKGLHGSVSSRSFTTPWHKEGGDILRLGDVDFQIKPLDEIPKKAILELFDQNSKPIVKLTTSGPLKTTKQKTKSAVEPDTSGPLKTTLWNKITGPKTKSPIKPAISEPRKTIWNKITGPKTKSPVEPPSSEPRKTIWNKITGPKTKSPVEPPSSEPRKTIWNKITGSKTEQIPKTKEEIGLAIVKMIKANFPLEEGQKITVNDPHIEGLNIGLDFVKAPGEKPGKIFEVVLEKSSVEELGDKTKTKASVDFTFGMRNTGKAVTTKDDLKVLDSDLQFRENLKHDLSLQGTSVESLLHLTTAKVEPFLGLRGASIEKALGVTETKIGKELASKNALLKDYFLLQKTPIDQSLLLPGKLIGEFTSSLKAIPKSRSSKVPIKKSHLLLKAQSLASPNAPMNRSLLLPGKLIGEFTSSLKAIPKSRSSSEVMGDILVTSPSGYPIPKTGTALEELTGKPIPSDSPIKKALSSSEKLTEQSPSLPRKPLTWYYSSSKERMELFRLFPLTSAEIFRSLPETRIATYYPRTFNPDRGRMKDGQRAYWLGVTQAIYNNNKLYLEKTERFRKAHPGVPFSDFDESIPVSFVTTPPTSSKIIGNISILKNPTITASAVSISKSSILSTKLPTTSARSSSLIPSARSSSIPSARSSSLIPSARSSSIPSARSSSSIPSARSSSSIPSARSSSIPSARSSSSIPSARSSSSIPSVRPSSSIPSVRPSSSIPSARPSSSIPSTKPPSSIPGRFSPPSSLRNRRKILPFLHLDTEYSESIRKKNKKTPKPKDFIGNVPLTQIVGVYKRPDIIYGQARVESIRRKELRSRKNISTPASKYARTKKQKPTPLRKTKNTRNKSKPILSDF